MKIKNYKCPCGFDDFYLINNGNQVGIHCSHCGKWFKWADKDERNLIKKPKPDLNEMWLEIEKGYRDVKNDYDCGVNYGTYRALQIIREYVEDK